MAEARFALTIDLPGVAPARVHDFLLDLHGYRDLHPLIERIDDLAPHPDRPRARRYRVTDRLAFGPVKFRIAYCAELEDVSPTEVRGTAWQQPGIEVHTRYRLAPTPEGTRLEEDARLQAPWLLLGYTRRQAEAAHRETLAKLRARLSGGSATEC